jgi:hypothetical protein
MSNPVSSVNGGSDVGGTYDIGVARTALDTEKRQGAEAVALIENAAPPAPHDGKGLHVNVYA